MTINMFLVGATCLISILGFNNPSIISKGAHHPYSEAHRGEWYRLLSSGFFHADVFHLFVNMFVLYGFGDFIEHQFKGIFGPLGGGIIYVVFYLALIILANLPNYSKHKDNPRYSAIGASGATSGIVFSYILFEPLSMLQLYFFFPIPAIVFGVLYLLYSSYAGKNMSDNIDHAAHFYGALAGFLLTIALKKELIIDFFYELTSILR